MAEFCKCGRPGCDLIVNAQRVQSRDEVVAVLPTLEQRVADLEQRLAKAERYIEHVVKWGTF